MTELRAFIAGLPKAELHIHLEGSLEPEMMFALARRNRVDIPFRSAEEVRAAYSFSNLQDFLDIYYQGAAVFRTEEDFFDLTLAYLKRARGDGACHAEMFFDPQTHTARGIAFGTVVDGVAKAQATARETLGITSRLTLCFLRHLSEEEAFATLRLADVLRDKIDGIGLDSSELGNPPAKFARVFAAAREGTRSAAHRPPRPRQPFAGGCGLGPAAGGGADDADGVSAVELQVMRRA